MKKLFCLLFVSFLLSCSQDESILPVDESVSLRATADPKYKELGWGIDLTGDYLSLNAVKAPVIDVIKFEKDFSTRIISKGGDPSGQRYSYTNVFYGDNAKNYLRNIDLNVNASFGGTDGKEKFSGTIDRNFTIKQAYASNYTFVGRDECIEVGKAYFVEQDVAILQKYLDSGFLYSLANKPVATVISEYGTHVLLDITLGGKLSLLYRSEVINTTKETTAKAGFSLVLGAFGLGGSGSVNTQLINNNTNAYLYAKSTGGTKSISESWDFNNGALKNVSTAEWNGSVNFANCVVLKVQKAVPIYDLVADPTKKAQIKAAVEKYMADRELELLTPIYCYFSDSWKDHLYTTDSSELNGTTGNSSWKYERIIGYVYSTQIPGTVPIYRYFSNNWKDHLYTTNSSELNGTAGNSSWKYEGIIGYTYNTQIQGTVPVYRYFSNSWKDHLYTPSPSEQNGTAGNSFWKFENIGFYIYAP